MAFIWRFPEFGGKLKQTKDTNCDARYKGFLKERLSVVKIGE